MRLTGQELALMLLGSGEMEGPLYDRLAFGLSELIRRGEIPAGCRLPSERALAMEYRVSRTTVVAAYRSLQSRGVIERREGSGTRVPLPTTGAMRETVSTGPAGAHLAAQFIHGPRATVDFATAALPGLPMVAETAAAVPRTEYDLLVTGHHGYDPQGLASLRKALVAYHAGDGLRYSEDEILITSGAQQALEVVAAGCLRPGDTVVVEDPTYRGALEVFERAGCRVVGVSCDEDGIHVDEVERVMTSRPARLIYVQSTIQNPTGSRLAPERRKRLLDLAALRGTIIVDDASLADTAFDQDPPRPLVGRDDGATVLTIGSMNKLYWGGLRLGWIRAQRDVISRLAQVKGLADFGTSMLSQHVAVQLLDRKDVARHERREELARSLAIATTMLADLLPRWTWWRAKGGPSLWVRLPETDASQFAALALRFGVSVLPGSAFSADGRDSNYLRLPFALPGRELETGIGRLAQAWLSFERHGSIQVPVSSIST